MENKTALIIGAGPAGLTAAHEFVVKTDIKPIVLEMSDSIGGISRTVDYKGNRIDIGGHRFFSKSDKVMDYWQNIFPLQGAPSKDDAALGRLISLSKKAGAPDPEKADDVMLVRNRVSRIFFLRKFFDYPISLNFQTAKNLGIVRLCKIGFSYVMASFFPKKDEKTLEDFLINRFGKELYLTFFKDYTKKVWGVSCEEIPSEWGAQRIKGLSVRRAIWHAIKEIIHKDKSVEQKKTETSLIEEFMYPKLGPGQLWDEVAEIIKSKGGEILLHHRAIAFNCNGKSISDVTVRNEKTGELKKYKADYIVSSMPIKELVGGMNSDVPGDVQEVARGLPYRDFITVGLLLKKMKIKNRTNTPTVNNIVPDNWIYIQERDVKLGRLQIFNNWSPYLVKDENNVWVGLEYFCAEGDELWSMPDEDFAEFAIDELQKIDIIHKEDVLDSVVIRTPKAYPAYFGTYNRLGVVREYLDKFEDLYLIGRNGMHRYNNQDHSMLTAMLVVENISKGVTSKENIWAVNAEDEYHEEKS